LNETALGKLKAVFDEAMPLPVGINYDEIAYGKTGGWDSVAHMALISQIESTFDVMLDTGDVIDLSSFPKAKEILGRQGVAFE
jgi:acyl carrier protein